MHNSKFTFRQNSQGLSIINILSYSASSNLICSELSTKNIIMLSKLYSLVFGPKAIFLPNIIVSVIRVPLCLSICNYSVIKCILFDQYQETYFSVYLQTGKECYFQLHYIQKQSIKSFHFVSDFFCKLSLCIS